jgi:hypothetical protein
MNGSKGLVGSCQQAGRMLSEGRMKIISCNSLERFGSEAIKEFLYHILIVKQIVYKQTKKKRRSYL